MWKDSETEIDYLDFSYIVEIMKDTINDEKLLPSCIGLYGDWGSGKSSLMHMCKKQLEEQKDGTVCLLFNGWLYESYDDAKTAILRVNHFGQTIRNEVFSVELYLLIMDIFMIWITNGTISFRDRLGLRCLQS